MLGQYEHKPYASREIIFEVGYSNLSPSTNVTCRQTDGQTDDMQSQDHALHYSASRGKKTSIIYKRSYDNLWNVQKRI